MPHRVRNVHGATKTAAEDLAELTAGDGLPVVVLRVARFFPEPDDADDARAAYADAGLEAVEFLYRRVDLADAVEAHLPAADRAPDLGFVRLVVSATTPAEHPGPPDRREGLPPDTDRRVRPLIGALTPSAVAAPAPPRPRRRRRPWPSAAR